LIAQAERIYSLKPNQYLSEVRRDVEEYAFNFQLTEATAKSFAEILNLVSDINRNRNKMTESQNFPIVNAARCSTDSILEDLFIHTWSALVTS
jgi:hypothetical protein